MLDDADLGVAVNCAVNSGFFSTGQRCTASSRVIVTDAMGLTQEVADCMSARFAAEAFDESVGREVRRHFASSSTISIPS